MKPLPLSKKGCANMNQTIKHNDFRALPFSVYITALAAILPVYMLLNSIFELYAPKRILSRRTEFTNIFKANTIGFMIFTLVLFLGSKNIYFYHFSRRLTVLFYVLSIVFMTIERNAVRMTLRSMSAKGYNLKHILLVGYSRAAEYKGIMVIGKIYDLSDFLKMNMLDEIAITLSLNYYDHLEGIVRECEKSGVHTKFIPDYNNVIPTVPYTEDLFGLPVINIRHVPLTEFWNAFVKRIVDILAGIVGLIVFSPIMLIVAIAVKLTSRGPIIFSQERVGLHNRPFKMYKFRSMTVQPVKKEVKGWTTKEDPRVTAVGKFIRKTSIDETPQFFNILIGDMSIVGPRPERPYFVEKFKEEIPHYMIKHQVRPGLTGWAQVNGYRGDTSIEKRIEHDLYYIENWTLSFDIKIMFLTIFKGFINKNAY